MRFRKLTIQNFRSHIDTTLDLEPTTVIRGPNSAGKSSIEQAIQITLAAGAEGLDAAGRGVAGLIRAGAPKATIALTVDVPKMSENGSYLPAYEPLTLKCALNADNKRAVIVKKEDDPQYSGGSEWIDYLSDNRAVLSCLCNDRYFVDLDPAEQQNVLASIILPKKHDWPEWVKPMANDLGLRLHWERTPFEVIDEGYTQAYAERTNINRDVKNFRMPEGSTEDADKFEEWSKRLEERKGQLDAAKRNKFQAESESRNAATLLQAAQDRLTAAQGRLSREQQEIPGIEGKVLSPAKVKEHEKVAKNAAKVSAADAEIVRLATDMELNRKAYAAITALAEEPKCPTCASSITEEMVQAMAGPIVTAKNALSEQHKAAVDARKALGDPAAAKLALEANERAATDLKRAQQRIAEEQKAIADAQEGIDANRSFNQPDTAAFDEEIADLTEKVATGTTNVSLARVAKELADRKARAKVEQDALVKKQGDIGKLVEYFGKDGVKAELLKTAVGSFVEEMNEVLAEWHYTCELTIEPYVFAIMVRGDNDEPHYIPLKFLSKSQRYRFAVAFQVALAIVTGFKFVIVDEADIFDREGTRGALFEALGKGNLDQVIVLGTDERVAVPDAPDTAFYRLEDTAREGHIPTTQVRRLLPAKKEAA